MSAVGKALSHEAATLHVTGAAKYVDDLGANIARLCHAWPVQAPVVKRSGQDLDA